MPTLFTRIINQEIPSFKIYEDAHTYVFLTIEPMYPGHTLVVPKVEEDKRYSQTNETLHLLMNTAKHIAPILEKSFDAQRVALVIEGLEVPHTHLHLIPLPVGKGLADSTPTKESLEVLGQVQQLILQHMK